MAGELLVVGGGVGGVSAARAAARRGIDGLTEPTDELAGALANQRAPETSYGSSG